MDGPPAHESKSRGSFFSSLNRSFRLGSGRARGHGSNPRSFDMDTGLNPQSEPLASLRPLEIVAPRIDSYRFSMANLQETQDADLDAILGELCALDSECDEEISRVATGYSTIPKDMSEASEGGSQRAELFGKDCVDGSSGMARTDSPDNDSAFSDTVSMLSSESSASSSASSKCKVVKHNLHENPKDPSFEQKAHKIRLALERMREANVKKLFIKAFSADGSSKSLLVDEKMTCGFVTRLLADKNHVTMEPRWALVEQLPDLHMERVYEDHEMLVDNLMLWTRESKNRILFTERRDKTALFQTPEKFLLTEDDRGWSSEHDEHSRQLILEEFFGRGGGSSLPSVAGHPVPPTEGSLYLKSDAKKGWKKYHFVLRPSGLYYSPKDKAKTLKELVCLATFDTNEVYTGVNWKKKYKSPTDYCFAIKHPRLQQPKSVKFIKFLCADDPHTLERWLTAIRIAKHGRQLLENYRSLVEELTQEDLDHLAHARSCSISSIPRKTCGGAAAAASGAAPMSCGASVANSDISSGRHSRASSSSSSGCLSDGGTASESAFDCEFPMGTIKRKPSMKANIPLTWMGRQLKEMAESGAVPEEPGDGDGDGGTLTRRSRPPPDDSTLKRHHATLDAGESVYSSPSSSVLNPSGSPARFAPASPTYEHYEAVGRDGLYGYAAFAGPAEELPPPPPVEDAMFSSTLSLDSLPPPPPLEHLAELSGPPTPQPPPPPVVVAMLPRLPSVDSAGSDQSLYGACLVELQTKKLSSPALQKTPEPAKERPGSLKKVNFADDLPTVKKKVTLLVGADAGGSPRKPPPPKRNESTRLTSPKKLADSTSNPPKDFLKDLQRVMRKKWQVAQKCALEPATTPHEVLGFREYPLTEDYKETSVSMWVQEHYGGGVEDPYYENVLGREQAGAPAPAPRREPPPPAKKRPPPAPPRRSDSTHLSHAHPPAVQPTA